MPSIIKYSSSIFRTFNSGAEKFESILLVKNYVFLVDKKHIQPALAWKVL